MYLKRCEIKNFRSVKDLEITFEKNFQILVGLNESGKTNILKALSFLEKKTLPNENDIRDPRHDENPIDEAYVRFVFGLEKKETNDIINKIKPLFFSKNYDQPIVQIGSKDYSLSEFCNFKKEGLYTVDLLKKEKSPKHWALQGSHYTLLKSWKKVPPNWPHLANFENKNFKYIFIDDFPELQGEALEDIQFNELNSVVGSEIIQIIKDNLFDCIIWNYSNSNLLPGRIDIEGFKANPNTCEPLTNIFYLAGFDDISKTITDAQTKVNGMTNLLRRLSDNSTKHLRKVWPEYKKISINLRQNGSVIEAGIEDEFNIYSLDRRSDGFKRFITFLLMISAKVKADYLYNSVIIIDEPDIGLHPSGIQFLREELNKISKDNIVVIATHSIFMIDKDRIDRHVIVKKDKEETTITSDYTSEMLDEEVIYRALGYSLFEMLKKKNVIFEGWSDKYAFYCWINSNRIDKTVKGKWQNLGLLHALGAKDVQRVAAHLEDFEREYIIISDSDKPSLEYQKKFEGKYKWFTYKDLGFKDQETIEDFINEDYILNIIKETLKKEQLDKDVVIEPNTIFNSKMKKLSEFLSIGKNDFERIKRIIKNKIFENLEPKDLELENLIKSISI